MKPINTFILVIIFTNCLFTLKGQWRITSNEVKDLYQQSYPNNYPYEIYDETIVSANSISSWSKEGKLYIKLSDTLFIQIFSLTGKVVFAEITPEGEYSFNLPRGVYFIRANDQTLKVVNR